MDSCKCNKECLCEAMGAINYNGQGTTSHVLGSNIWSVNPCQPWVSSLFNSHIDTSSNISSSHYTSRGMSFENRWIYQYDELFNSRKEGYPTQARRKTLQKKSAIPANPVLLPTYSIIGHPSLRICKFRLPPNLLHLLSTTFEECELHAKSLRNGKLFTRINQSVDRFSLLNRMPFE